VACSCGLLGPMGAGTRGGGGEDDEGRGKAAPPPPGLAHCAVAILTSHSTPHICLETAVRRGRHATHTQENK